MKIWIAVALFACLLQAALCDDDWCTSDYHCDSDECCAKSIWGSGKVCKDRGDDRGDRCGGQYACNCERGLQCVPDSSFSGRFRVGTGSCQPIGYY